MDMNGLNQALPITGGQLTLRADTLPGAPLPALLKAYNASAPLVISGAQKESGPDQITVTGTATFMNVVSLPVTAVFTLNSSGTPVATLRFPLLTRDGNRNAWRFSMSFPTMPLFADYAPNMSQTRFNLLDELPLTDAVFVLTTAAGSDAPTGAPLSQGLNFVGHLSPTGLLGLFESTLTSTAELLLYGRIVMPVMGEVTQSLPFNTFPWQATWEVPGIHLEAGLHLDFALSSLRLQESKFRIYTPTSQDWLDTNPSYEPVRAVTGLLDIPSAKVQAAVSAKLVRGVQEVYLSGEFTGLSLDRLESLVDLTQVGNLIDLLPSALQDALKKLGGLSLMRLGIALNGSLSPSAVSYVVLTVGMPKLNWTIFSGFTVESMGAEFFVGSPFTAGRQITMTLLGTLSLAGAGFDLRTEVPGFTVRAELNRGVTLPLSSLFQQYLPELPAPPNLSVDSMQLMVSPGKAYWFEAIMADQVPWTIDLGPVPLTIVDVRLELSKPASGSLDGNFSGSLLLGSNFELNVDYNLPGDLAIRSLVPQIKLSDLIATLVNQPVTIPEQFDLTFENSSILIEKESDLYRLQMGTQLKGFGIFAMEVRKRSGAEWGFAAGLDLSSGLPSQLPALGPLKAFEDLFTLQKLVLVISTFPDSTFQFPDMAVFNNPQIAGGRLQLPGQGGVIAGFNFFGAWRINTSNQQQKLLQDLLGLDPEVAITLQLGSDTFTLFASYTTQIEGWPLMAKFGGKVSSGSVGLFLEGAMTVQIQGQKQTFDVKLDFVENGAFISTTMKGSTPVTIRFEEIEVFKLGNLALVIGCDWEGIPSVGVAGTLAAVGIESSIAVFVNSAEPQNSVVAGAVSDLSLKTVVDNLTGNALPSEIDDVLDLVKIQGTRHFTIPADLADDLDDLQLSKVAAAFSVNGVTIPTSLEQVFLVVDKAGERWFLTDKTNKLRHYQLYKGANGIDVSLEAQLYCVPHRTQIGALEPLDPDFYINGAIRVFGFNAQATIDINPNKGIAVDAQMDRIVIGHEKLFSLTAARGDGGPIISASTFTQPDLDVPEFRPPHFYINGKLELLGLSRITFASLTTSGFEFDLKGDITPFLYMDLQGHFYSLSNMGVGGGIRVGLDTIDLGPLGKITIDTGVSGNLDLRVDGSTITAKADCSFKFAGQGFSFGVTFDLETGSLLELPKMAFEKVKELLLQFLQDAVRWAEMVAKGFIRGVEDIAAVLESEFKKTAEEAKQIAETAWKLAQQTCAVTTAALHL